MALTALRPRQIFDGTQIRDGVLLLLDGGRIAGIVGPGDLPAGTLVEELDGLLAPGFVDAQVNGGGGAMLNDDPSATTMQRIAAAHRRYGTTSLLPTLITDQPEAMQRLLSAPIGAGVAGLHLEGPHLAPARKGAHLAELMRPLTEADISVYIGAATRFPALVLTLAAEQASPEQVARLVRGGVTVSLGHTDCDHATALRFFEAGARGATHLFNAMAPLGHRAPGLPGAVLDHPGAWAGIIADGHHVDPAMLRIALRAKRGPGRLFLVTDAMALVGSESDSFMLNGRTVSRTDDAGVSRLTLEDGTLAGSDLDMATALRFAVRQLELPLETALAMAATWPADYLGLSDRGRLQAGQRADLVLLDADLKPSRTWVEGVESPKQ
ncbi:N-acetylglucosamine-6-phosphate deacetylase [Frigidibacter sp. ROC022]|uniref:N-acetylglucosamine-6-phosphate deacetylase n=1 Tax=Frigidibacter sp. ROC022 TaxID=2971796 RepID=UPI00215A25B0|nr:N-acetylglucosamine-6-phosphate deacetylase [Frigidibacter sp. ROC022]MCR8724393.1 N-acetylglucosamine-6-phosphate deacetylase [Frigidibacter sp. ROC022]